MSAAKPRDQLNISVSAQPAGTRVLLSGECDASSAPRLHRALADQDRPAAALIIADLSGLQFLDIAVVHALIETHDALAGQGKRLILLSPQPLVARVLELTGADQLIPIYDGWMTGQAPGDDRSGPLADYERQRCRHLHSSGLTAASAVTVQLSPCPQINKATPCYADLEVRLSGTIPHPIRSKSYHCQVRSTSATPIRYTTAFVQLSALAPL